MAHRICMPCIPCKYVCLNVYCFCISQVDEYLTERGSAVEQEVAADITLQILDVLLKSEHSLNNQQVCVIDLIKMHGNNMWKIILRLCLRAFFSQFSPELSQTVYFSIKIKENEDAKNIVHNTHVCQVLFAVALIFDTIFS